MNLFLFGLIICLGILSIGIVYLSSFDKESEKTFQDTMIIDALTNIEFGKDRDNDTHYERTDREKKYYASMTNIKLLDNDSIQITFDPNYFQFDRNGGYVEPVVSSSNSEFTAVIDENQTFVAACNSFSLPESPPGEKIPVKQIHVLKYLGITEKDEIAYFGFVHEAGYISDEIECTFPEIIQYSLDADFDVSEDTNYYGEVWDHDWT